MRRPCASLFLSFVTASSLFALTARAADIPATSAIDGVIVFPQGAEVRRVTKVKIPAGTHTLIIPDLPAQAQAASIRVEGKATGRLEIGSVDSRSLSVPRGDAEAAASARRRIEAEIEKMRDERAGIVAERSRECRKEYVSDCKYDFCRRFFFRFMPIQL